VFSGTEELISTYPKETGNRLPDLWSKKEIGYVLVVVVQRVEIYSKSVVRSSGHYLDVFTVQQVVMSLKMQLAKSVLLFCSSVKDVIGLLFTPVGQQSTDEYSLSSRETSPQVVIADASAKEIGIFLEGHSSILNLPMDNEHRV
jgi:hypothetical protein